MTDETVSPRVRSGAAMASTILVIRVLSSAAFVSVPLSPGKCMKARAVHILASALYLAAILLLDPPPASGTLLTLSRAQSTLFPVNMCPCEEG